MNTVYSLAFLKMVFFHWEKYPERQILGHVWLSKNTAVFPELVFCLYLQEQMGDLCVPVASDGTLFKIVASLTNTVTFLWL